MLTAGTISLANNVVIECCAANYKSVRGRAIAVCLIDEAAFLPSTDSAQPDVELLNAITPALGRFPGGGTLLVGSTPYRMQGILHDGWKAYYGQDDPEVLVWQAPTRFDQRTIDREIAKSPGPKTAEYMALFRADVSDFISLEMLQKCLQVGVRERGYHSTLNDSAFLDPSGGGKDAFTLAICHREDDVIILDLIRVARTTIAATL